MPSPKEKLAASLEILQALQQGGRVAIRSRDLSRTHRERLVQNGFLREVMKGWYIPAHPQETLGDSTAWYTSFWAFCAGYLASRFGAAWSLSPEQSLMLHIGNRTVPRQLLVRATKGRNHILALPYGTSLLDVKANLPEPGEQDEMEGLRLFSLPAALVEAGPAFFERHPTDARTALAMLRDASAILEKLLNGGHSFIAGRLAGGLRDIGRGRKACAGRYGEKKSFTRISLVGQGDTPLAVVLEIFGFDAERHRRFGGSERAEMDQEQAQG